MHSTMAAVVYLGSPFSLTGVAVIIGSLLAVVLSIDLILSAAESPSPRVHRALTIAMMPLFLLFVLSMALVMFVQ